MRSLRGVIEVANLDEDYRRPRQLEEKVAPQVENRITPRSFDPGPRIFDVREHSAERQLVDLTKVMIAINAWILSGVTRSLAQKALESISDKSD